MSPLSRLLCRIGWHEWIALRNPETRVHYLQCARCLKEADTVELIDYGQG